ncbi:MAG: glycosyltransferase family A protein, partial [Planctomycetota bacterium]
MDKIPLISIIIPAYNRGHLLKRTIESVLTQTFHDFELIIVDDGSTDDTKEVVGNLQKRDSRIKYIWQKNSGAPARPKNTGIKNSKGEFIAFLDDDDEWLSQKLEKQIQLFRNSQKRNLGFIGCNAFIVNGKNNKTQEYITPRYKNIFRKLLESDFIWSSSSIIIKRKVFDDIGLFDERLKMADDWDMWIRIARKYDFDFVPEPLLKYFWHEENFTKTLGGLKRVQEHEYILGKHENLYKKYPKTYSVGLRKVGTLYLLNGDSKTARAYFIKAIKAAPLYARPYLNLVISLFGNKFYKKVLYQKRKISDDASSHILV